VGSFRNVIVCEDIREELGNKKSLMGIFPGDIVVQNLPATMQITFYIEYMPDSEDGENISFQFRLLENDQEFAKGGGTAPLVPKQIATIVLPRGIITFDKECKLRLLVSVKTGLEQELLAKRIIKGEIISSPIASARP
jgi:hypothetical protein